MAPGKVCLGSTPVGRSMQRHWFYLLLFLPGCTVGAAALSLLLLLLIKDLEAPENADPKKEALISNSQKDSDSSSSETSPESANGKPSMNGDGKTFVHVINDVEDLHRFMNDRHS